jgi:hypothetical protein
MKKYRFLLYMVVLILQGLIPVYIFSQDTTKNQSVEPLGENPTYRIFKERYPHPMFNGEVGTGIPRLTVVYVYDESQLVEDPIIPEPWIRVDSNEYFPLDSRGIQDAIKRIHFSPSTKEEAMSVAKLILNNDHICTVIFEYDSILPAKLLEMKGKDVEKLNLQKPKIVMDSATFKLEFYTFSSYTSYFRSGEIDYFVNKVYCNIGPSVLNIYMEDVWSLTEKRN